MRDATTLTQLGVPNVSVITAGLWSMFEIVADRSALSWVPAVEAPYPMRGRSDEEMTDIASALAPRIIDVWQGRVATYRRWDSTS